jgi:hypothetical protein
VLRVFGIPLRPGDVHRLLVTLLAAGSPAALDAALEIERTIERRASLVSLKPAQRTAILLTLENPPPELAELHDALLRDHEHRHGA